MPWRLYRLDCGCSGSHWIRTTDKECRVCGRPGEFMEWSRGMISSWAQYSSDFGLRAIYEGKGNHSKLYEEFFALRLRCSACDGTGFKLDPESPWMCAHCEGSGGFWNASEEAIRDVYRRLLKASPEAWHGRAPTGFPFAEGRYLDARPAPGVPGVVEPGHDPDTPEND